MIYVQDPDLTIHVGDVRDVLPTLDAGSVDCVVTSPPYWGLRDYGTDGQLGLEATPDLYVQNIVAVFREARRVLADHGTLWLNLGDSYGGGALGRNDAGRNFTGGGGNHEGSGNPGRQGFANIATGLKPKDLVGIPWRVAFALQQDGWYLRSDIVWSKPNPMPESVTDRPTKSHEYVFLLSKRPRYFFDQEAVREPAEWAMWGAQTVPKYNGTKSQTGWMEHKTREEREAMRATGRNVRSVWEIATQPYAEAHFATFPEELARRCILAGCPKGGVVLDPFLGSGTTALVARKHGRRCVGVELSRQYAALAARRCQQLSLLAETGL